MRKCLAAIALLVISSSTSQARTHQPSITCNNYGGCYTYHYQHKTYKRYAKRKKKKSIDANGNFVVEKMVTVPTAYGFNITVHPAFASKFLKFFELLKDAGHKIPNDDVGCYSRRGHVRGSNHYIGAACDIQTGWNRGPAFVYHIGDLIKKAGLFDGCSFRDCGHIEAVRGTHNKPPAFLASLENFKTEQEQFKVQQANAAAAIAVETHSAKSKQQQPPEEYVATPF